MDSKMDETVVQQIFLYPHDLMISVYENPNKPEYKYGICIAAGPIRQGEKIAIFKDCSTTKEELSLLLLSFLKNVYRLGKKMYLKSSDINPVLSLECINWIAWQVKNTGIANTWEYKSTT